MLIGHLKFKLKTAESVRKTCCGLNPAGTYGMKKWASVGIQV